MEESVTQVIEQQLKGLDNLIYMGSTSDASGSSRTTLTFNAGTNIDVAQVQVQNKLQQAMSRLPPAVQSRGVTVTKGGNDYLMIVSFTSPDPSVTQVDIGDYISSNLVDVISRVDGVGDVATFGTPYAMRVWMDPAKLEKYALMPSDVGSAINAQNAQVSAGQLGALPAVGGQQLNATITARSKLQSRAEFENIVLKVATDGSVVRLKDVARIELGAENLTITSRLNGRPGAGMGVVLADGANAMAVAEAVNAKIAELRPFFPYQLKPFTSYDTTPFVEASIDEVVKALAEAMVLVVLVMYLFLQNFRATLIPAIAVPVVLLGTFGGALGGGLFDQHAHDVRHGAGDRPAGGRRDRGGGERRARDERGRAYAEGGHPQVDGGDHAGPGGHRAHALGGVHPDGILRRLDGRDLPAVLDHRGFGDGAVGAGGPHAHAGALRHAAQAHPEGRAQPARRRAAARPAGLAGPLFAGFNRRFDRTADGYQRGVGRIVRRGGRMMLIYALIVGGMAVLFMRLPTSFLPNEDQGAMQVQITLPAGSSNTRLQAVMAEVQKYFAEQPDVVSFNSITGANGDQSSARGFVRLKTWSERQGPGQSADAIARKATRDLRRIRDARIFVVLPPAVRGLGANAGFNFQLKDLNGLGHAALVAARDQVLKLASGRPELSNVRSNNPDDTAQLGVSIDDAKAGALGLATADINSTLSSAIGGTYVNDFLNKGRVKRVYMQGDAPYRMLPQDIGPWTVRNNQGQMVPFSAFSSTNWTYGSPQLQRYNGSPSYEFVGDAAPGVSSGAAMAAVDEIMKQMPPGIGYEWTGASYQERLSGSQAPLLYAISILFVFLCLAALYESWSVPFSVILVVPLGIVGALLGIGIRGLSNDVYFQVGLLTTVGLASKNAILIVEFATQLQAAGRSVIDATLEAVRLRLRPILMTSLAFGFGVLPLAIGTGAGAGGRQAIGTAVLGGMVSATVLGIFFVPVFFVLIRGFFARRGARTGPDAAHPSAGIDAPPAFQPLPPEPPHDARALSLPFRLPAPRQRGGPWPPRCSRRAAPTSRRRSGSPRCPCRRWSVPRPPAAPTA